MNLNVKAILPAEKSVQMNNGSQAKLLIQKQFVARNASVGKPDARINEQGKPRLTHKQRSSSAVRVCKQAIVQAGLQSWILCTTGVKRACIIEPNVEQFRKHCLSTPNGTIDVEAKAPFHILVANFGLSDVLLPKGIALAYANPMNELLIRETN